MRTTGPPRVRRDVEDPLDVEAVVRHFYGTVAQDDVLGPIFNDVAQVDWGHHIQKLTAFWCRFLFKQPGYEGDPHEMHRVVHDRSPFSPETFRRWLDLFHDTLEDWHGPNVERMKLLAQSVARVHCRNLVGLDVDFGDGQIALRIAPQSPGR